MFRLTLLVLLVKSAQHLRLQMEIGIKLNGYACNKVQFYSVQIYGVAEQT